VLAKKSVERARRSVGVFIVMWVVDIVASDGSSSSV
jgi:hypothetical protein